MIRLALIGGGWQAAHQLAQAILRFRELSITAIVPEHGDTEGEEIVRASDGSIVVSTLDTLLAEYSDTFDAAIVRSHLSRRVSVACLVARAGKHVLVQSPMASSSEEATRLLNACNSAGVKLMVGCSWRFRPSIVAVKRALESGKLGRPIFLRIHAWMPQVVSTSTPFLPELVELLDLSLWIYGELPNEIFGMAGPGYDMPGKQTSDLHSHLAFPSEGMALVSLTHSLCSSSGYNCLTLIGSSGAAYADDHNQSQLLYKGGQPAAIKTGEELQELIGLLREFTESIVQDRLSSLTSTEGKDALVLAEWVLKSATERHPIRRIGDLYEPRL